MPGSTPAGGDPVDAVLADLDLALPATVGHAVQPTSGSSATDADGTWDSFADAVDLLVGDGEAEELWSNTWN